MQAAYIDKRGFFVIPFAISFLFWAVLHSVTASRGTKRRFQERFGRSAYDRWYRLLYNLFSVLSIMPVLYVLATAVPPRIIWTIPEPWSYLAQGGRFLALVALGISLWQTDVFSFLGLRQVLQRDPGAADEPFVDRGMYALVRHPLYVFSMVFIWLNPQMTLSSLLFNLLATLYFGIGSLYEEQRLAILFGDAYGQYQARVPRFIPRPLNRNSQA